MNFEPKWYAATSVETRIHFMLFMCYKFIQQFTKTLLHERMLSKL